MCTFSCSAVILKVAVLDDFDAQVTAFARRFGKLNLIARRVFRPGKLCGSIMVLTLCTLHLRRTAGSGFARIEECDREIAFPALAKDYLRFVCASYISELVLLAAPEPAYSPGLYDLLVAALDCIDKARGPEAAAIAAELRLLRELGFAPLFSACVRCGKEVKKGPCAFHIEAGGLICPNCADKPERSDRPRTIVKMSAGALAFARAALCKPVKSLRTTRISRALARELLQQLRLYKEYHLQIRLNSARLLGNWLKMTHEGRRMKHER